MEFSWAFRVQHSQVQEPCIYHIKIRRSIPLLNVLHYKLWFGHPMNYLQTKPHISLKINWDYLCFYNEKVSSLLLDRGLRLSKLGWLMDDWWCLGLEIKWFPMFKVFLMLHLILIVRLGYFVVGRCSMKCVDKL